jgi:hypothetical protein
MQLAGKGDEQMVRLPKFALITTLLVACTGLMSPNGADARGGGGGGGGHGGGGFGGGGGFRGGGFGGGGFGGGYRGFSSGGFSGYSRGGMGTATSGFRGTGGMAGFSRGGFNRGVGHVPAAPVTSRMHDGMGNGRNGFGRNGFGHRGFHGNRFGFFGPYWGFGWGFGPWWWWGDGLGYVDGGYGDYYNPYYTDSYLYGGYDYGQVLPEMSGTSEDDASFTEARADFYAGNYRKALLDIQPALQGLSGSPDVHEFHALILFALGDYYRSAAVAHTVLEAGPGWSWETLQSLYSSPEVYTQQLRALEHDVSEHPKDAGVRFLLGYHYAMLGHLSAAKHEFEKVVSLEPRDKLSAAILANLDHALKAQPQTTAPGTPGAAPSLPQAPIAPGVTPGPPEFPMEQDEAPNGPGAAAKLPSAPAQPATQAPAAKGLIGTWHANPVPGFVIEATLQPDGHFSWKASQGEHSETFTGTYAVKGNSLVLTRTDGQKMDGIITMKGEEGFNFRSKVTRREDPGLDFSK